MNRTHWNLVFVALMLAVNLNAETTPQGTVLDARVQMLTYNENQVYKITAYYGYQTDIELATSEEIRTVAAGDTVGWQIVSAGQHLFIKPMAAGARTNLSVVTSKRTYVFDLVSQAVSERRDMAYLVRFKYPQASVLVASHGGSPSGNPAAFNFAYKIKGDKSIRPSRVFDDGLFTFFQFDNPRNRDLPAIFWVSADGKENLVNYRMDGNYVVVERLGDQFVLRSGDDRVTVANKLKPEPAADPSTTPDGGDFHE